MREVHVRVIWGLGVSRRSTASRRVTVSITAAALALAALAVAPPVEAATAELVVHGGLEQGTNPPTCFQLVGWGTNSYTSEPSTSVTHSGNRAWKLSMTARDSGDRKLIISDAAGCAPAVNPGQRYDLSLWYQSTASANGFT